MLVLLLIAAVTTVGGFSYKTVTLSDRTKHVASAPEGYPATWKEHVEAIASTPPSDHDFNAYMRRQAVELQRSYYQDDSNPQRSLATYAVAGSVDISEDVIAASRDIVSVSTGASFYVAGMPHPNGYGGSNFTWSRRLHRVLTENDVFARSPDRALRQLALAQFDNRDDLQNQDDPDGISLPWDHANIGPKGITWSFGPYELGGYLSGGNTTISWAALKPYLQPNLPFTIKSIEEAPDQH